MASRWNINQNESRLTKEDGVAGQLTLSRVKFASSPNGCDTPGIG
jgi:hypothetical protein